MKRILSSSYKKLAFQFPEGYNWQNDLDEVDEESTKIPYNQKPGVGRHRDMQSHLFEHQCSDPNSCPLYNQLRNHIMELESLTIELPQSIENTSMLGRAAEQYIEQKIPEFHEIYDADSRDSSIDQIVNVIQEGYSKLLQSINHVTIKYNHMLYKSMQMKASKALDERLEFIGQIAKTDQHLQKIIKIMYMKPFETFDILPGMSQTLEEIRQRIG